MPIRGPSKREGVWRIEGDLRVFDPASPSQNRYVVSTSSEILFTGPWGAGGKSVGTCVKLLTFGQAYGPLRMGLGRKVKADMKNSTLRTLQAVVPAGMWARGLVGGEDAERLDFDNGSFIDFFGMDRRARLLSTEYDLLAFDECNELAEDDWEFALGRLGRSRYGSGISVLCGSTNPDNPGHFLYARFQPDEGTHAIYSDPEPCVDCDGRGKAERWFVDDETDRVWSEIHECRTCAGSGQCQVLLRECIVADPLDNAQNLNPKYVRRRARLTGIRKLRYDRGLWRAFTGVVYDVIDPNVHHVPRPPGWDAVWGGYPPPSWPRYRAIDFGYYPSPFVCQWWAVAPDGASYLYREIYRTKRTVNTLAKQMRELEEQEAATVAELFLEREQVKVDTWDWARVRETLKVPRPLYYGTFCDHDAEDRATLIEAGFANQPADKSWKPGIDAVYEALTPFEVAGEKKALLYFVRGALVEVDEELAEEHRGHPTSTFAEFASLLWKPQVEGREPKEGTIGPDHGMDALRYYVKTRATQTIRIYDPGAGD
jgi:hypothetical protein